MGSRSTISRLIDIDGKLGHGVVSFGEALLSDLINLGSARPEPMSAEERADQFREAAAVGGLRRQESDIIVNDREQDHGGCDQLTLGHKFYTRKTKQPAPPRF